MDLRSISVVLLKVAGLLFVAHAVTNVPSFFAFIVRDQVEIRETLVVLTIGLAPEVLVGVLLWLFPGTVTNRIVAGPPADAAFDFRELQLVALAVVGVAVMAHALAAAAQVAATALTVGRENPEMSLAPLAPRAVAIGVEFLLGLLICLGRAGITTLVEKMRGRES